jgi:hypothetical protein
MQSCPRPDESRLLMFQPLPSVYGSSSLPAQYVRGLHEDSGGNPDGGVVAVVLVVGFQVGEGSKKRKMRVRMEARKAHLAGGPVRGHPKQQQ